MDEKKFCKMCEQILPRQDFSIKNSKPDGLQIYCKYCMKQLNAARYKKYYKPVQAKKNKENKQSRKSLVLNIKQQNPCPCGEADPACLDFHHLENKDKTVSYFTNGTFSVEVILNEIRKCCVLCSNCHRKYHAGSSLKFDIGAMKTCLA